MGSQMPQVIIYNALIAASEKSSRWQLAKGFLARADKDRGFEGSFENLADFVFDRLDRSTYHRQCDRTSCNQMWCRTVQPSVQVPSNLSFAGDKLRRCVLFQWKACRCKGHCLVISISGPGGDVPFGGYLARIVIRLSDGWQKLWRCDKMWWAAEVLGNIFTFNSVAWQLGYLTSSESQSATAVRSSQLLPVVVLGKLPADCCSSVAMGLSKVLTSNFIHCPRLSLSCGHSRTDIITYNAAINACEATLACADHIPLEIWANIWMFPKIVGFPPKSSILMGFSTIFTIHFGVYTPNFWKHPYGSEGYES